MLQIFNQIPSNKILSNWVPKKMKKNSWVCTLITQLLLCFALFLVLQIGRTQKPIYSSKLERNDFDIYFISVRGGFRPIEEQSHLLKQIEKVIKAYKVRFVVNISELGEEDPLNQNATRYFQPFKVPWYATKSSKTNGDHYFLRKVKGPKGNTLDVFFVNTGLFQGTSNVSTDVQFNWLERDFKSSDANWHIVAGFHPIIACNHTDQAEKLGTLYQIFLKHGVNAYISGEACSNSSHECVKADITGAVAKGPYFTAINQILNFDNIHIEHDFLLHRVSSLEMVTYFVSMAGEIVHRIPIRQLGRETM